MSGLEGCFSNRELDKRLQWTAHGERRRRPPGLCVLDDGGQLLVVPHQDEALGVDERPQAHGLADLRGLVHDAEVKATAAKEGVLHTHTGSGHDQLWGGGGREWMSKEKQ